MLKTSPVGFWVAQILIEFEGADQPSDVSILEKSTVLLKALERKEAIKKAIEYAHYLDDIECIVEETGIRGFWKFVGIVGLYPVVEELKDETELFSEEFYDLDKKTIDTWLENGRSDMGQDGKAFRNGSCRKC